MDPDLDNKENRELVEPGLKGEKKYSYKVSGLFFTESTSLSWT